jgi:1,4-alpha-glucan branching enzyme/maltooligosyltrehalose trehalohydrolase
MLHELSREVGKLAAETGRWLHVVLENDDNRATLLDPVTNPSRGQYRAQWNDDYHHAWHVLLTGEDTGYYSDYAPKPIEHIVRALSSGFAYQGEPSAHRDGTPRGEPSGGLPPAAFVNFLQNHDQIGNRALGDRLESLANPKAIEAALAITLLAPMVPMLFQGDEWGSKTPFPFFCDFKGDLAEAVRQGRKKEFASAYEKYGDDIPDPLDESTFQLAVLDWTDRDSASGRQRLAMARDLLGLRSQHVIPRLAGARFGKAAADDSGLLTAHWRMGDGRGLHLLANLSDNAIDCEPETADRVTIWGLETTGALAPWSVRFSLGDS